MYWIVSWSSLGPPYSGGQLVEGVEAENRIEQNSRTCECAGLALNPHTVVAS